MIRNNVQEKGNDCERDMMDGEAKEGYSGGIWILWTSEREAEEAEMINDSRRGEKEWCFEASPGDVMR